MSYLNLSIVLEIKCSEQMNGLVHKASEIEYAVKIILEPFFDTKK